LGVIRISQGPKPDMGCFEKKVATAAKELPLENSAFGFYPNPAKNAISIQGGTGYSLKFFDSQGQLFISKEGLNGLVKIDLPDAAPGIYFIRYSEDDIQVTKKLIIN
jgi:hypothetical protein